MTSQAASLKAKTAMPASLLPPVDVDENLEKNNNNNENSIVPPSFLTRSDLLFGIASFPFNIARGRRVNYTSYHLSFFKTSRTRFKGQMNQNFDIWSFASLKQLNTTTDHYKVYSPKNFASWTFMRVIYLKVRRFPKSSRKTFSKWPRTFNGGNEN